MQLIVFASCLPCKVFWLLKIRKIFCVVFTGQLVDWLTIFLSDTTINIFVKQVDLNYWRKSGEKSTNHSILTLCGSFSVHIVSITSLTRLTASFQMIYANNSRGLDG